MTQPTMQLTEVIRGAMSETFEGMAFLVITLAEDNTEASDVPEEWMWARVEVKDPFSGSFTIVFSKSIAAEITQVLFGEDEILDDEKLGDVLKEMVNTMAGRCMNCLVPSDKSFALGLPATGKGWPKVGTMPVFRFNTDEGKPLAAVIDIPLEKMAAVS